MDDVNDGGLLGCGHLVVGRQAEAAAEEVGPVVDAITCNVGVGGASAVASWWCVQLFRSNVTV